MSHVLISGDIDMAFETPTDLEQLFPITHVGPGLLRDFETVAILQSLLMYPQVSQMESRRQAFLALCAAFAEALQRTSPSEAHGLRESNPEYFEVAPKVFRKALRDLKSAAHVRLRAALIARPFVNKAALGERFERPEGVYDLTVTSAADYAAAQHEITDKDNLIRRIWQPSLPVLPLAIGLEQACFQLGRVSPDDPGIEKGVEPVVCEMNMEDIELWCLAVQLSQMALAIVQAEPLIEFSDHKFVRISWHA